MKVTSDIAIFDDHQPLGMRVRVCVLGFALMFAARLAWMISDSFFPAPTTPQVLLEAIKDKE